MSTKVLGRIATVLSVNAKPLQGGLNLAKGELEKFASTVQSRIGAAGTSAERALKGMYTDFQRLQRAVKAANSQRLDLKVENVKAILDVARATERIAKPVGEAQKQFSALSAEVQSALLPVLVSAQRQSENFFDALSRGVKVTDRDFANTEARIERVTQAIRRATEASQATRGLASGQELRFQNPEFLRATSRAAELQRQAAQLSPEAIAGRGIVGLVGQQRVAADEAERLRATIDRIAATRNGDARAAQQAYARQEADLERINDALQEQITLANQAASAAQQAARQRGAFDTRELDRRSGAAARRRGNAFEDATAGVFAAGQRRDEQFIGQAVTSVDSLIARIRELNQQYQSLSPAAQSSLAPQVSALNSIANAAVAGSAGVGTLENAFNRTAASIQAAADSEENFRDALARTAAEQASDAQRRAEAASRFLPVDQQGSDILSNEGRSTPLAGNRDPRTRVIAQLGQDVGDLRNRVRGVGETLAGDVGPIVDNLTTRFQNMARAGVGVAAEQARQLAREVANINAALDSRRSIGSRFEESFGGAGRAGLSLGVDERSLRAIGGQIEFVQGRLSALGQEVRGPVIAALDTFRTRARELFDGGAIDTTEGRAELQRLREELARTLAAAGGGNERRITEQLNRVGDVARGAFGNAGLAIQQAAFAFEDFFSVTGGLDQRIRAAGNNISQLGFILGGTTGLIFGISAAIGSQLIVALINWSNGGRTAEDQTKALNDALARQKSLVEDLKQAFESLGDSIAERTFSEPAKQARQFEKALDDIAKKQKEARENRIADTDPYVQRERAEQNRIQREMAATSDPETFLRLQRDLQRAQRAERAVREGAIAGLPRSQADRDREIAGLERVLTNVNDRNFRTGGVGRPVAANQARELIAGLQGGTAQQQVAQLRDQQRAIDNEARSGRLNRGAADDAIAQLESIINRIDFAATRAIDELTISIIRSSQAASLEIESAQADVADAIRRGVPGAALLQQNLDAISDEMDAAQKRLRDAQNSDAPDREQQINLAQRDIDGIRAREDAIAEASRDIRLTSGRGGERTTAALSALQGNERFANEYGRLTARLRDAVDAENAARLANEKAMKDGSDADKEAARAAYEAAAATSDLAAAAAEAALAMEQAVSRTRKIGADAVAQSERAADEAQQRFNERPTDENRQRRDAAERQLIRDRERVAQANNALDRRRSELQTSDPRLVQINAELEAINQERRRLSDEAAKNGTSVSAADAQRLADREAKLLAEREQRLFSLTEAERRQQDAINQEIRARERLVNFMDEVERRRNPQGDPVRGLDLMERPGERAARELRQSIADINAAFDAQIDALIEAGNGVVDQNFLDQANDAKDRRDEAIARAREESLRQTAPAIFGLADQVQNALLQGPSRAALQPTDVSTVEGSRELTRLLRGDDAARDQANLVELQREANRLLDIIANNPAPVAN